MDAVGALGTCMTCKILHLAVSMVQVLFSPSTMFAVGGVHLNTALVDRCLWMVMLPWQQVYSWEIFLWTQMVLCVLMALEYQNVMVAAGG